MCTCYTDVGRVVVVYRKYRKASFDSHLIVEASGLMDPRVASCKPRNGIIEVYIPGTGVHI